MLPDLRRPAAFSLLAFLLPAFLLSACGSDPTTLPRSEDLLARTVPAGPMVLESRMGKVREVHCQSRTQYGIELQDGARRSAVVLSGENARLIVSGCRPLPPATSPPDAGTLTLTVESRGSDSRQVAWTIPDREAWWQREVDLSDLAGEVLRLRLHARLSEEGRLFLSQVTLRHEVRPEVPAPSHRPRRPHQVLLVSLDTLRHDAVDTDPRGDTPTFARLAREAEQWSPHYAASSWTQPSHAALLTGQPLVVHATEGHVVHPAVTTLAERFRAAGFRTAGAVYDCVWLGEKFGFDRGFEQYHVGKWRMDAAVDHALNWIGEHRGEDFFFFFHTFEPHSDFRRLPYESTTFDRAALAELGFPGYGCRQGRCASRLLKGIKEGEVLPLPGEGELLHRLYRAGVKDTDRTLGELLQGLERLGVWEDLLLVVTSDHGEMFLEKGEVLHGSFWEPVVRVPLFIKWPRGRHEGRIRTAPTSALDLAPTLLAAFDLPADDLPGSLLAKRRKVGASGAAGPPVFIDAGGWRAVLTTGSERLKLVEHRFQDTRHLFDLKADPEERNDLWPQRSRDVERLQALLARHDERSLLAVETAEERKRRAQWLDTAPGTELDPEERERLRSLGY